MELTIFKTKSNKKFPESPFNDNTFIFENVKVETLFQAFNILVSNNVLCLPLNIDQPIRASRKLSDLGKLAKNSYDYIILDIDCNALYKKDAIIDYLKEYNCIIGKSRSYNGVDNFNLKCILKCVKLNKEELEILRLKIAKDLLDFCEISTDSTKITAFFAPILKSEILLNNENGKIAEKLNLKKSDFYQNIDIELEFNTTDLPERCLYTFKYLGYKIKDIKNNVTRYELNGILYNWNPEYPYYLFTDNALKSINVYKTVTRGIRELIIYNNNFKGFPKSKVLNKQFITNFDIQNEINQFSDAKNAVMYIKSPMGTAKSSAIKEIISLCLQKEQKILIITPRISVARDYYEKYKDIENDFLNRKVEIYLSSPKKFDVLICQYDSLFKYKEIKFDLVIFDEFASIMNYSIESASNNFKNFEFLYEVLYKKTNLLVADAFLTGFESQIIKRKTEIFIENIYRDNVAVIEINSKELFFKTLINGVKSAKEMGSKVTVSVTSNKYMFAIADCLRNVGLKAQILWGNNTKELNEHIFSLMQLEKHDFWDVLIYSPVLTVGVSNLNLISEHYHFDTSKSVDAISSLQMIKRSRKVSKIYYYIEEYRRYAPITFDKIKEQELSTVEKGVTYYEIFGYNKFNELNLKGVGELYLKISLFKNILSLSRKEIFRYFLNYQFTDYAGLEKNNAVDIKNYEFIGNIETKNNLSSKDYETFFNMIGVSNYKNSEFKELSYVYERTKLDVINNDNDKLVFESLSDAYINDKNILFKCWLYNIIKHKSKEEICKLIEENFLNKSKADILKLILKTDFKLEDREYTTNEDTFTKKILNHCGFKVKNGIFIVDEKVELFYKYVIDF